MGAITTNKTKAAEIRKKYLEKITKDSAASKFYNALKNDPQSIVEWCDAEIAEYEKLKSIVLGNNKELVEKIFKKDNKTI